jgi:hypothetical protein
LGVKVEDAADRGSMVDSYFQFQLKCNLPVSSNSFYGWNASSLRGITILIAQDVFESAATTAEL